MLNPMRDKSEGTYRGGEGTTPVTTRLVQKKIAEEKKLSRVKLESEGDD